MMDSRSSGSSALPFRTKKSSRFCNKFSGSRNVLIVIRVKPFWVLLSLRCRNRKSQSLPGADVTSMIEDKPTPEIKTSPR